MFLIKTRKYAFSSWCILVNLGSWNYISETVYCGVDVIDNFEVISYWIQLPRGKNMHIYKQEIKLHIEKNVPTCEHSVSVVYFSKLSTVKKLRNQNAKSSERNNWGVYLIVKDQTHWKIKKNECEQSACDPGRVL